MAKSRCEELYFLLKSAILLNSIISAVLMAGIARGKDASIVDNNYISTSMIDAVRASFGAGGEALFDIIFFISSSYAEFFVASFTKRQVAYLSENEEALRRNRDEYIELVEPVDAVKAIDENGSTINKKKYYLESQTSYNKKRLAKILTGFALLTIMSVLNPILSSMTSNLIFQGLVGSVNSFVCVTGMIFFASIAKTFISEIDEKYGKDSIEAKRLKVTIGIITSFISIGLIGVVKDYGDKFTQIAWLNNILSTSLMSIVALLGIAVFARRILESLFQERIIKSSLGSQFNNLMGKDNENDSFTNNAINRNEDVVCREDHKDKDGNIIRIAVPDGQKLVFNNNKLIKLETQYVKDKGGALYKLDQESKVQTNKVMMIDGRTITIPYGKKLLNNTLTKPKQSVLGVVYANDTNGDQYLVEDDKMHNVSSTGLTKSELVFSNQLTSLTSKDWSEFAIDEEGNCYKIEDEDEEDKAKKLLSNRKKALLKLSILGVACYAATIACYATQFLLGKYGDTLFSFAGSAANSSMINFVPSEVSYLAAIIFGGLAVGFMFKIVNIIGFNIAKKDQLDQEIHQALEKPKELEKLKKNLNDEKYFNKIYCAGTSMAAVFISAATLATVSAYFTEIISSKTLIPIILGSIIIITRVLFTFAISFNAKNIIIDEVLQEMTTSEGCRSSTELLLIKY